MLHSSTSGQLAKMFKSNDITYTTLKKKLRVYVSVYIYIHPSFNLFQLYTETIAFCELHEEESKSIKLYNITEDHFHQKISSTATADDGSSRSSSFSISNSGSNSVNSVSASFFKSIIDNSSSLLTTSSAAPSS